MGLARSTLEKPLSYLISFQLWAGLQIVVGQCFLPVANKAFKRVIHPWHLIHWYRLFFQGHNCIHTRIIASHIICIFLSHVSLFFTRSVMLTFSKYELRVTLWLSCWSLVMMDRFEGCVLQQDKGWSSIDAWSDRQKAGRFIGSS